MSYFKRWYEVPQIKEKSFLCWSCMNNVAGDRGYFQKDTDRKIYICPNCEAPNYFNNTGTQYPGIKYGNIVKAVPDDVFQIYEESRNCFSVNAFTGSALLSRKILMNIAVTKGAEEDKTFGFYVDWLNNKNFLPPDGKEWVDHIRKIGNQGTHEIKSISKEDAEELINFCEMLLKFIFEFPARMKENISKQ